MTLVCVKIRCCVLWKHWLPPYLKTMQLRQVTEEISQVQLREASCDIDMD